MKKIFTLILFNIVLGLKAQIYVNSAATGSANGTSWANAYTDLQAALNDATGTNIWIAKGTYKPAGAATDTTVSYKMTTAKNIYGGFAGTETSLAQRNPATNVVVLSGDVNGDDKADSVYVNKKDNRRHVLIIEPTVTGVALLDGMTISGGASRDTTTTRVSPRETHGAGVLSYASININNCKFTGNRGVVGSALATYDLDTIKNIVVNITKSSFTKNGNLVNANPNQATTFGTAAYIWLASSLKVDSCSFSENIGGRGALCIDSIFTAVVTNSSFTKNINSAAAPGGGYYSIRTKSSIVRNCEFVDNSITGTGSAAGMFFEVTTNLSSTALNYSADTTALNIIENCLFRGNKAPLGTSPAIRLQGGSNVLINNNIFEDNTSMSTTSGSVVTVLGGGNVFGRPKNVIITNNNFRRNTLTSTATNVVSGGLLVSLASATIEKCLFNNNTGVRGGGIGVTGISFNGEKVFVSDCEFNNNTTTSLGGAIQNSASFSSSTLFINNCKFNSNKGNSGGAIFTGFKAATEINNSEFSLNISTSTGGALGLSNDSSSIKVRNTLFLLNSSTTNGGVLNSALENTISFVNCKFEGNKSTTGRGGVFNFLGVRNSRLKFDNVFIDRCEFIGNEAIGQGGAINITNKGLLIQNSIFSSNTATMTGTGGAISYNSTDSLNERPMTLLNNTFDNNIGASISGVSVYQDPGKVQSLVTFQNNLFIEETGIKIEANQPTVRSLGGNLFINNKSDSLTIALDKKESTFSFLEPAVYSLKPTSLAVNGGIAAGAPLYDFNGKLRVGIPDIGGVENGATVTNISEKLLTAISVFPNPTSDKLTILDENNVATGDRYVIFNVAGKIVQRGRINDSKTFDISSIGTGEHFVRVYNEKIIQAKFMVVR
jgi:hypothetical protein